MNKSGHTLSVVDPATRQTVATVPTGQRTTHMVAVGEVLAGDEPDGMAWIG